MAVNLKKPPKPPTEAQKAFEAKVKNAQRSAANASWQLLLGFGVSFAVRVDRRWLGGTGIGAAAIIVLVIFYSFYMLYADLMRYERRMQAEKAQAEAEMREKI